LCETGFVNNLLKLPQRRRGNLYYFNVIPAQAGIHEQGAKTKDFLPAPLLAGLMVSWHQWTGLPWELMDSRLRGNDAGFAIVISVSLL
jgi:hypothetical protein